MIDLDKFNTYKDFMEYMYYISSMKRVLHEYKNSCNDETFAIVQKQADEINDTYNELSRINSAILGQYLDNRRIFDIIIKSLYISDNNSYDIRAVIEPYNNCKKVIRINQLSLKKDNFVEGNKGFVFLVNKIISDNELVNYVKNNDSFKDSEYIIFYDSFSDMNFDEYLDKETLCDYATLFLNIDEKSLNNINELLFEEYKKSINREKVKTKTLENDK